MSDNYESQIRNLIMGNTEICFCEERSTAVPALTQFQKRLIKINSETIAKFQNVESPVQQDFITFHRKIELLIKSSLDPNPPDPPSQPPKIIKESANQGLRMSFYAQLKARIQENPRSLFNLIVREYFQFLIVKLDIKAKTFIKTTITSKNNEKADSNVENSDTSYNLSSRETAKEISNVKLQGPRNKALVEMVMQQMNGVFMLCREIVCLGLSQQLLEYFGRDSDYFPQKELLIQRLIQHRLLGKRSPLKKIFSCLIRSYYLHADMSIMQFSLVPERATVLDQQQFDISEQLKPALAIDGDQTIQNITKDSFLESSGASIKQSDDNFEASVKSCQQKQQEFNNLLERTSKFLMQGDIPYAQTFPLLTELIRATKPWKKFLLIEKFDKMIARIFLTNRSQTKMNELEELLAAEDTKSEIYIFIIHQYNQQFKVNYHELLYNGIRIMQDFDGLLHKDVKYVFCPFFVRFYSLLELYISNEETQKES